MRLSPTLFLLKSSIFPLVFALFWWPYALVLSILIVAFYRSLIGFLFCLKPMPSPDMSTFLGIKIQNVNFMSAIELEYLPAEKLKERAFNLMKRMKKMRYRIVDILGDFYYKELPIEQALGTVFVIIPQELKDYKDIDKFIEENINVELPLSEPQYRYFYKEHFGNGSLLVWKQHHSFCDGASSMAFILASGDHYDPSAMIPIRKVSFMQKLMLKLSIPLLLPKVFLKLLLYKV